MGTVYHLNCGTLCPAAGRFVTGTGGGLGRGEMVCHCILIETESDGLILIDTGLGVLDVQTPRRLPIEFRLLAAPVLHLAETAVEQVRALGFDPTDVRHIIVTHLDLDHAGGLADFPAARVHLHALELDAALNPRSRAQRRRYPKDRWAHGPQWESYSEAGDDWNGFEAVRKLSGIDEDIALVPLFGHTRGHCGVAIRAGEGWILHAGDAYFHRHQVKREPPSPPRLVDFIERHDCADKTMRARNLDRLRRLHKTSGHSVEIVSAHDVQEFQNISGYRPNSNRFHVVD